MRFILNKKQKKFKLKIKIVKELIHITLKIYKSYSLFD